MVDDLPLVVVVRIAKKLSRDEQLATLASLVSTCRLHYDTLLPVLYRHIGLSTANCRFFHGLSNELLTRCPHTPWDRARLEVFGLFENERPSGQYTSSTARSAMVHTITVNNAPTASRVYLKAIRRHSLALGNWIPAKDTTIPPLFPQLSSLVFSEDLMRDACRRFVSLDECDRQSLEYQEKKRRQDQWREWSATLTALCGALGALIRPERICLHLPRQMDMVMSDPGIGIHAMVSRFPPDDTRHRSWMFHNLVDLEWVHGTPLEVGTIHVRPTFDGDQAAYLDSVLVLLHSRHQSGPSVSRTVIYGNLPFAEGDPSSLDHAVIHSPASQEGDLPTDVDLDRADLLGLPSRFAEVLWMHARGTTSSATEGWNTPNTIQPVPWSRLFCLLKSQLVYVAELSDREGICHFCGGE